MASVPSECVFSAEGNIVTAKRACLSTCCVFYMTTRSDFLKTPLLYWPLHCVALISIYLAELQYLKYIMIPKCLYHLN